MTERYYPTQTDYIEKLNEDAASIAAITAGALRYDQAQSLSGGEKTQVQTNLGLPAAVLATPVTGLTRTTGELLATDTVLQALGKVKSQNLLAWAYSQAFRLTSATRNTDGAITSATIAWPDGVTGAFTSDTLSTDFPGAIDAWHATYVGATTLTVTQTAVTRDSTGAVTAQPAITIT